MRRDQNENTQPFIDMPVFQNWRVVARAWYFGCRSKEIGVGDARSLNLCGQHVVLFRGEDGRVRALDGFCPHMGTDLGIGTVKGNRIACFFHHWEFDGEGVCQKVPCGEAPPSKACLRSYAVSEKYGALWVFPDREADFPLPEFEGLETGEVTVAFGKSYERTCHHHVTMINGIDAQHLKTVHGFDIAMDLSICEDEEPSLIDFSLSGRLPDRNLKDRLLIRLVGPEYGYAMRYSAGSVGLLTMAQRLRWFGKFPVPSVRMIFAYRPIEFGRTLVQPIFLTRKRRGPWGKLKAWMLLWITRRMFHALRSEDGMVYDNMRFNPANLIKMDKPVAVFIRTINRLTPSIWSAGGPDRNPAKSPGGRMKILGKKSKKEWLTQYSENHQNRVNRFCHLVGIPLFTLALPLFVLTFFFREWWLVPAVMFVAGWALQFEGKPPEFFKDWRFFLVGLRWWFAKVRGN